MTSGSTSVCPGNGTGGGVAHTTAGDLVGFALPTRTASAASVGYLAVLPEHRGYGYVTDLLVKITRQHAHRGAPKITGTTDATNTPMAAAFDRGGYDRTGTRLVLSQPRWRLSERCRRSTTSEDSCPCVEPVIAVTAPLLPLLRPDAPRIVNVSSSAGSLTETSDFANADLIALGCVPSKTALTSPTIQYARGLAAENILVDAVCPGFVARDLNSFHGVRSTSEGAVQAVRMVTIPADGPTGTFTDGHGPVAW